MASHDVWIKVYDLLRDVTPLTVDCGQLCSSRCCTEWEEGVGMYLLPGEESMFTGTEPWAEWHHHNVDEYDFCPSWTGVIKSVPFITCRGQCPRDTRPFACRSFPLTPHLDDEGGFTLVFDDNGILICPLIQLSDMSVLNPQFVENCSKAWKLLIESDPLIADDVKYDSHSRSIDKKHDPLHALLGRTGDEK